MIIDVENVPEWAYATSKPLNYFIPVVEHYAICNNCALLHLKSVSDEEQTITEEAPICQECSGINDIITRIALHN